MKSVWQKSWQRSFTEKENAAGSALYDGVKNACLQTGLVEVKWLHITVVYSKRKEKMLLIEERIKAVSKERIQVVFSDGGSFDGVIVFKYK